MASSALDELAANASERLLALSRRCRDLSDMTMVPDVSRELISIATELEREADRVVRR
jgi:hypothetical protein